MFFPPKEVLYERLFCEEQGEAIRLHDEKPEIHTSLVRNKERSPKSRTQKKDRVKQTDLNRHGLLDAG